MLVFYALTTVYPLLAPAVIERFTKPPEAQDQRLIDAACTKFRAVIGPFLAGQLGLSDFMTGDTISAADILLAKPLTNAHQLGLLVADFPTLHALYERLAARASYKAAWSVQPAA